MAGKLFIVPTPVGNLEDMTPRAIRVLQEADLILAEDTRTSAPMLRHFGIATPMLSHHKYNEHQTVSNITERILGGQTIALISDAGTPGISDPGFLLSRQCSQEGIEVETLPGPTAVIPALVNSGLPIDRFAFEGFLPPKKGRLTRLKELAEEPRTWAFYESPLRLQKTLAELAEIIGPDRPSAVCREISKLHDTTARGTLASLAEFYQTNQPRGEIVVIVGGRPQVPKSEHKNKYKNSEQ